jgi:hypothetical protein
MRSLINKIIRHAQYHQHPNPYSTRVWQTKSAPGVRAADVIAGKVTCQFFNVYLSLERKGEH